MIRFSIGAALGSMLLAGCASSAHVRPARADAMVFSSWSCDSLLAEFDNVQAQAAVHASRLDQQVGRNAAVALGTLMFWPALLAMKPGTAESDELARLKGREDAVRHAMRQKACPSPDEMPAAQQANLPVHVGDRLVYDDRLQSSDKPRGLMYSLEAIRRRTLEFRVEPGGRRWTQDLAGNVLFGSGAQQLRWHHWLVRDLSLGQTLQGELVAEDSSRTVEIRGQVMGVTPQEIDGRQFDVAVIDFSGRIAGEEGGVGALRGSMAVDRKSGVLVRLDIDSADLAFARWRRLRSIVAQPG